MKKVIVMALLSLMVLPVMAQLPTEIAKAYPKAKSIKKESKWTIVYDANQAVIGYAVYSKPSSDGIKGYAGETPLMIALSTDKKVLRVELLPNSETPQYVAKVKAAGFFKSWNGLTAKKACKKKVDAVAGATYTSTGVTKSLQAALKGF